MPAGFTTARQIVFVRFLIIIFGCITVIWSLIVFPVFRQQSAIEKIATRIIEGDKFRIGQLIELTPTIKMIEEGEYCRPSAIRSAAIIRIRILEDALAAHESASIDARMNAVKDVIHSSLVCTPADPFLLLVLFWIENTRDGFSSDHLGLLRMSYQSGPNEGWVSLKRSHIALGFFAQLPPDIVESTLNEFAGMINSSFFSEAANILTGPGWPIRGILLSTLANVNERHRKSFAETLNARGYDIFVPGIEQMNLRFHR